MIARSSSVAVAADLAGREDRRPVEAVVAAIEVLRIDLQRPPHLRRLGGIDVEVGRQAEAARHDADDFDRHVVRASFATDDRGIAAVARLPQRIAQARRPADRWADLRRR